MNIKKIFLSLLTLLSFTCAEAEDITGIYVWANGTSTCFKFESYPRIEFGDRTAHVYIDGCSDYTLKLNLEDKSDLEITVGTYRDAAGIDNVSSSAQPTPVHKNGKYIEGGKLVVVKSGKQYDANGIELKK